MPTTTIVGGCGCCGPAGLMLGCANFCPGGIPRRLRVRVFNSFGGASAACCPLDETQDFVYTGPPELAVWGGSFGTGPCGVSLAIRCIPFPQLPFGCAPPPPACNGACILQMQ